MDTPARIDWGADRYAAFIRTVAFVAYDFTDASFAAQVRSRKDGGTLYADLSTVTTAAAEGVLLIYGGIASLADHIASDRLTSAEAAELPYALTDMVPLSLVGIRINKATMTAMPYGAPRGDNEVLYWDLQVTPSGGTADVYAAGTFTVRGGVVQ